jgi:hypothetical protein
MTTWPSRRTPAFSCDLSSPFPDLQLLVQRTSLIRHSAGPFRRHRRWFPASAMLALACQDEVWLRSRGGMITVVASARSLHFCLLFWPSIWQCEKFSATGTCLTMNASDRQTRPLETRAQRRASWHAEQTLREWSALQGQLRFGCLVFRLTCMPRC